MKASDKLKERTRTAQYRRFLRLANKAADEGKNSILCIKLEPHTRQIFETEGFMLEDTDWHGNTQTKISWEQEK